MALTHQEDHEGAALARRAEEFKPATKLADILSSLAEEAQALEEALWQLYTERDIDSAVGAQLDQLGAKLGLARDSSDDEVYRLHMRGWIRALRSNGSAEDILAVLRALSPAGTFHLRSEYPKAFTVVAEDDATTESLAHVMMRFLQRSKAAGERALLEWIEGLDEESFYTAQATFADGAQSAGDTLTVLSTEGFPDAGTLILSEGTAAEDEAEYTGKTDTTFTGVTGWSVAQPDRAAVSLADEPGLGFGDSADESLGGELAAAGEHP